MMISYIEDVAYLMLCIGGIQLSYFYYGSVFGYGRDVDGILVEIYGSRRGNGVP